MPDGSQMIEKIVFFGAFSPASMAFARSCRAHGVETYLLEPGGQSPATPVSSALAGQRGFDRTLARSEAGLQAILDYAQEVGAGALTTLAESNAHWLAAARARFEPAIRLLVPPIECLERLASKARQMELARAAGFEILPTWQVRGQTDIDAIEPARYPLALRPEAAGAVEHSFRIEIARSAAELASVLERVHLLRHSLLAQPFLDVPNLVLHCSSTAEGRLLSCDAFLADRKFEGLALRLKRTEVPAGLREKTERFAAGAGLVGAYHLDFLFDPATGTSYYLEMNARFGGTTDKMVRFGVDEPANCLRAHGLTTPRSGAERQGGPQVVVNKRATLKHLLAVLGRAPQPWDYPQESRLRSALRSLGDLLWAADSIFDWHDLRGVVSYQLQRGEQ